MIFEQHQTYWEKIIIFCLLVFSLTFVINEKIADTFIRTAFLLILIYNLKQPSINLNWQYYKLYLSPLILFYMIIFILLFFSTDFYRSILIYESWIKMIIPFLAIIFFNVKKNTLPILCIALLVSFIGNDIYSIYIYFTHNLNRIGGFDNNVMSFANILLVQIPVFLILCLKKPFNAYKRIFAIFILGIILFAMFVNNTRAIWFISIIDFLFLFLFLVKNWQLKLSIMILFISLLTCVYNFNGKINNRINDIFNTNNVSTRGHYFYMRDGYNLFLHNMPFGVGLGNFPYAIIEQNLLSLDSTNNLKHDGAIIINNTRVMLHAHNDFITFLAQFGVSGGILYLLLYGTILFSIYKNWLHKKQLIDLVMFIITINFLLHGVIEYNFSNLNAMTIYFFIWAIYIKYNQTDDKILSIKKLNIIFPYVFIIFIILLRIISRYLIKYH